MKAKPQRTPITTSSSIVLGAQLAILCMAIISFYLLYLGRPTFPDEGPTSSPALLSLAAMLPSLILVYSVWFRLRSVPTFGLLLSFIMLAMEIGATSISLSLLLWIVTFFGCVFAIRSDPEGIESALGLSKAIWKQVKPLAALGLALSILASPMLLLHLAFSGGHGRGDYVGVAPEGSVAVRRAWAKHEMFTYFELTEKWVRNSKMIRDDLGTVIDVAPIDGPNRFVAGGFTDGSHCRMNLQVIGEKGEGVLYLPIVNVNNMYQLYDISELSTWTFDGKSNVIDHSGKSWADANGHAERLQHIENCKAEKNHDGVVKACRSLSEAMQDDIASENSESQRKFYFSQQMFVDMSPKERCEMLTTFGESLAELGKSKESIEALVQSAEVALRNVDQLSNGWIDPNNTDKRAAEWLSIANDALIKANRIHPNHETVLKLARERTSKRAQCDVVSSAADGSEEDKESRERDSLERQLGQMFRSAKYVANKSQWLKDQMGQMRMRPELGYCNELYINKNGYYACSRMSVEIAGQWGHGGHLKMRMKEIESQVAPLDLFSDTPRRPALNYTFSSVSWHVQGEKSVRLSAKTLAPRQRKANRKQVAAK